MLPIKLDQDRPHRDLRLVVQLLPLRLHRATVKSAGRPRPRSRCNYNTGSPSRCRSADEHPLPRAQPGRRSGRSASPSIAALILLAFNADDLPIIGGGDTYYAAFTEAGGLKANDEVRIAGVRVGKVDRSSLDGDHVKVAFRVEDGADFGTDTRAAIKVKTLLGAMYLALEPAGAGQLHEGTEIPVDAHHLAVRRGAGVLGPGRDARSRSTPTSSPQSLTTLADLTRNTPEEFRHALAGVSALSTNLAARDEQIGTLLPNLQQVSHDARRPRPGHRRPDAGLRRAVPGAGRAPRRRCTTCCVSTSPAVRAS